MCQDPREIEDYPELSAENIEDRLEGFLYILMKKLPLPKIESIINNERSWFSSI